MSAASGDPAADSFPAWLQQKYGKAPWWMFSITLHLSAILLFCLSLMAFPSSHPVDLRPGLPLDASSSAQELSPPITGDSIEIEIPEMESHTIPGPVEFQNPIQVQGVDVTFDDTDQNPLKRAGANGTTPPCACCNADCHPAGRPCACRHWGGCGTGNCPPTQWP